MSESQSKPPNWSPKKRGSSHHNRNKSPNRKRRKNANVIPAEPPMPICTVCSDPEKPSSYKCPKCRAVYCSVACCKEHKKVCPQTPPETTKADSHPTLFGGTVASLDLTQLRPHNRYEEDDDDSLDNEWKLTDEMKLAVEQSDWLRTHLQSDGGLRDVIRQVAASRNVESMQKVQQRFPNFRVFLDKLMVVAGILEREPEDDNEDMEPLHEWLQRDWGQDPSPPHLSLKPLRRKMPNFQPVDLSSSSEDDNGKDESTVSSDDDESSDESDT